jgi:hypothetical protein
MPVYYSKIKNIKMTHNNGCNYDTNDHSNCVLATVFHLMKERADESSIIAIN